MQAKLNAPKLIRPLTNALIALVVFYPPGLRAAEVKGSASSLERFAPPPFSPNCVTSEIAAGSFHYIDPLTMTRSKDDAKVALKRIVESQPRVKLITDDGDYLHYEFRSMIFRFVDDVEFRLDEASNTIRVRSASRLGFSDLGANRRRVENLRKLLDGQI